ncbi:unnamed protein product [Arctia plantaginis]|uniref:Uncharacterized protein n=1 Tax=Arctia plantaginis TaxID=874455 RepID=A0A8S0YYX9_ARCPL|nr:unnamed protein product [Arctia plantaginis]
MLGRSVRLFITIPTTAFNRSNVYTVTEFTSGLAATLAAARGLHLFKHYSRRHINPTHFVLYECAWCVTIALSNTINGRYAYRSVDVPRSTGYQPAGDNGARAGASRMRAPPLPATPARSHNGKRLGAHVISESESVTHFPAIQVYVSARSRGCATERVEDGAGGGPLT